MFIQLDLALIIAGLFFGAWIASKLLLRELSVERTLALRAHFKNAGYYLILAASLFLVFTALSQTAAISSALQHVKIYIGLVTIFLGSLVFLKVCKILVFEYLYLSHMKVAFPVLLVNLFTLLIAVLLGSWIGAELFNISLTPLLATSAIFSLVLGLALQDTLGNLFAGVALQFDKPYEIGDWIEIQTSGQKWAGQVKEISWRATLLTSFTKELITIPNRVISQSQISNFSIKHGPVIQTLIFRLPFGCDISEVKKLLSSSTAQVEGVRSLPPPNCVIADTTESWICFKSIFWIDQYGERTHIADRVYTRCLSDLKTAGIPLVSHRISINNISA